MKQPFFLAGTKPRHYKDQQPRDARPAGAGLQAARSGRLKPCPYIVLCVLAVVLLFATAAQAQITSDTLWKWQWVGDAQISPDAGKIAYVHISVNEDKDNYVSALWLADVKTGALRQMTTATARHWSPRWSPDGTRIAFVSNRGGRAPQIHILPVDGGEAVAVTRMKNGAGNIEWSPDGKWLAFTSRVGPSADDMKPEPGKEHAPKEKVITRLMYRADGAGYLPEGHTHIFIADAAGSGEPKQVTSGDFNHGAPAWSPDGKWIAFSSIRKPDPDYEMGDSEIYVISPQGGEPKQLTDRRGPDGNPAWSPDGKWIAYTGSDDKSLSYTVTKLYVMSADGSSKRELTNERVWDRSAGDGVIGDCGAPFGGMGGDIMWSPDGQRILFLSADRGTSNVYWVAAGGGAVTPLTKGEHDIAGFSLAGNGQIAVVRAAINSPFDVFTLSMSAPELKRLTNVNAELLKGRTLVDEEMFWYRSFDGRQIQAWVMKPVGFVEGRKYPMILYIHGGPHAMYGTTFFHEFQVLASRGYVVLITNPRGSTGYGQEFGNVIQYKYPGDDYKDLMAGVDELLKRGYVDEKRMGVAGGSGGGVLTAWTIGHTNRFAAAAPQRGVYNWYTFVSTSDFNLNFARRWFRDFPWNDTKDYLERSPIYHVKNITTPTLVVHNEEDWRVPIAQGEELYTSLKMLKRGTKMVRFPEEPHGLSRMGRPSHRVARINHIAEWMDKYLKPGN